MKSSIVLAVSAVLVTGSMTCAQYSGQSQKEKQRMSAQQPGEVHRLSRLIGRDCETSNRRNIGEIENLTVDFNQSAITHVVLDVNEDIGARSDLIVVPFDSFQFEQAARSDEAVIVTMDLNEL